MTAGDGLDAFADGIRLLRRSRVGLYVWPPALLSLVIISLGLWLGISWVDRLGIWARELLPDWLDFLSSVLVPLLYLILGLIGTWLFGFLAVVLSSPLHGNLAAALAAELAGHVPAIEQNTWRMILNTIRREGQKLRYQLPRLLGVGLMSFVPVVNVIAAPIGFLLAAWLLAAQFVDLSAENRGLPFTTTLEKLRSHRLAALTFGGCVVLLLAVPLVNFLTVPVAVAGGVVFWSRLK